MAVSAFQIGADQLPGHGGLFGSLDEGNPVAAEPVQEVLADGGLGRSCGLATYFCLFLHFGMERCLSVTWRKGGWCRHGLGRLESRPRAGLPALQSALDAIGQGSESTVESSYFTRLYDGRLGGRAGRLVTTRDDRQGWCFRCGCEGRGIGRDLGGSSGSSPVPDRRRIRPEWGTFG